MNHDTNPSRIAALSEQPTPGPWIGVSVEIDHTDGSPPIERTMLASLPPGLTHEQATPADLIEVAMFVRAADARRVMACVAACSGMPTEFIESIPMAAVLQTTVEKLTKVYNAAQDDATWEAMREEILSFHTIKIAH